jgi:hypothetical protein
VKTWKTWADFAGDSGYYEMPAGPTATGDPLWREAHGDLMALHLSKSATYGSDDDRLANLVEVAKVSGDAPERYALLRITEKVRRALNMLESGRFGEIEEFMDIAGLALCAEALRRRR